MSRVLSKIVWVVCILIACGLFGVASHIFAKNEAPAEIRVLRIEGVINPLSARYLKREIEKASQDKAQAVILELNTPGGLESSMREMVQSMLASSIPVVVYVTPQGARAASAGMFLTVAGHVAAMAPGTNIGAAHPVSIGGGGQGQQKPDETMKEKVVSDAAALARSVAKERGRNTAWVEEAVRKSVSITANEAVQNKVVDFVAVDRGDLLKKLNGRKVSTRSGVVTLETNNARTTEREMHIPERILHAITDPNIAYLLISIGFIGIIAELYSPGLFFPGIIGVISLILGFAAIGSLPIGWAGIVLLLIGIGLLVLEAQEPGVGIFGAAGIIAFVLGSLMLYAPISTPSPALPRARVNPWLIGGITALLSAFVAVVFKAALAAKKYPSAVGSAALVGSLGVAMTAFEPKGTVKIDSEDWSAVLAPEAGNDTLQPGDVLEIVGTEGAILLVRKHEKPIEAQHQKQKVAR